MRLSDDPVLRALQEANKAGFEAAVALDHLAVAVEKADCVPVSEVDWKMKIKGSWPKAEEEMTQ